MKKNLDLGYHADPDVYSIGALPKHGAGYPLSKDGRRRLAASADSGISSSIRP